MGCCSKSKNSKGSCCRCCCKGIFKCCKGCCKFCCSSCCNKCVTQPDSSSKSTCCCCSNCCRTKYDNEEKTGGRKHPETGGTCCRRKLSDWWKPTMLLISCIVFTLTIGLGIFLLLHRSTRKFPDLTPYFMHKITFYATVTYMFWTSFFAFIFLILFNCQCYNCCCKCLRIFWAFLHVIIGLVLLVQIYWITVNKKYDPDTLKSLSPETANWLVYLERNEICCGVQNSLDISAASVKSNCDPVFHSMKLSIGCGLLVKNYVKRCQMLMLIFLMIAITAGLLPFVFFTKNQDEIRKENAIVPVASSRMEPGTHRHLRDTGVG